MLSPAVSSRARDSANCHARLRVTNVIAPDGYDGGPCEIEARVERVFRGDAAIAQSQAVTLRVFCFVPPDGSPTGPTWLNFHELRIDALLEGFLNRASDGSFEVAMLQIAVTRAAEPAPDAALWVPASVAAESGWPARLVRRLSGQK